MSSRIEDFLIHCKSIEFGKGQLSEEESAFGRRFSQEIVEFCRSLPGPAQTDSMLFLMQYSRIGLGDELDFFADDYSPIWSIIYWLSHSDALPTERLQGEDIKNAVTAQSMAMFLHSLDDHLIDGQVPVSPLTLLLRSQAWTIMDRSFNKLIHGMPTGERTVRRLIDDYYVGFTDSQRLNSLDDYCALFKKQMAIGMIAPILLSMKMTGMSGLVKDIELACASFGIAWRVLDDIHDMDEDIKHGVHSALYFCLPVGPRALWDTITTGKQTSVDNAVNSIVEHISECRHVDALQQVLRTELEKAASIVEIHNMEGLAREFRDLAYPFR